MNTNPDITSLLADVTKGNKESEQKLIPMIYNELYKLADKNLIGWQNNKTLNATALVHEAYLKIISNSDKNWENRVHFFSVASKAMRCILVDHAKKQKARKRGSGKKALPIEEVMLCPEEKADEVIALDEALKRLENINEVYSKIVEYRFFCGYNIEETSALMNTSTATVKRNWNLARSWLYREIHREL